MKNNTFTATKTQAFINRLANLPRLSDTPQTPITLTKPNDNFGKPSNIYCSVCEKLIPQTEKEFSISNRVCAECLAIYAKIETALNDATERRFREKQLERLAEKVNGGAKK